MRMRDGRNSWQTRAHVDTQPDEQTHCPVCSTGSTIRRAMVRESTEGDTASNGGRACDAATE